LGRLGFCSLFTILQQGPFRPNARLTNKHDKF